VVRTVRAFTMMELLVTLGILAVALGSVLSIFARGSQFGLRAQERTEGARVAQAVFDLVDRGFLVAATRRGRQDDGTIPDEPVGIFSHDLATATELDGMAFSAWRPAHVIRSHLDLVWDAKVTTPPPSAGPGLEWTNLQGVHLLEVTVRFDGDGDKAYDASRDRLVGKYYAILADREVSP